MSVPEEINVSIAVAVNPQRAFAAFTEEVDLWWQTGPAYRTSAQSHLTIEPEVGGRFLDVHASNGQVREIGRVLIWEPGSRFKVEWRGSNFKNLEVTYIDVQFTAESGGTRVSLRHYGWQVLPLDHPARHGLSGREFNAFFGRWWASLLEAWQANVDNNL